MLADLVRNGRTRTSRGSGHVSRRCCAQTSSRPNRGKLASTMPFVTTWGDQNIGHTLNFPHDLASRYDSHLWQEAQTRSMTALNERKEEGRPWLASMLWKGCLPHQLNCKGSRVSYFLHQYQPVLITGGSYILAGRAVMYGTVPWQLK